MLSFFSQAPVRDAIATLAQASRITVVAGAGASMEIGLPSWETLVLRLLGDVIERNGWSEDSEAFQAAARQSGLLTTAEMVEAMLVGQEMPDAIKVHLYGSSDPARLQPGPLAKAIASLQDEFGEAMRLATTNYDEVLELALRARPPGERWWRHVLSAVRPGDPGPGTVAVTHLHGLLGRRAKGEVILSEGDYQRMQLRRTWQEDWMVDALSSTTCLFVGASMTDANLIRYLYRAGRSGTAPEEPEEPSRDRHPRPGVHVALFRRRQARTAEEARFRDRSETTEQARWARLGITPLFADNFADIAQFAHEVADRRRSGARAYRSLPVRLRAWHDRERESGSLYCADDEGYREVQELLHAGLERLIGDAVTLLDGLGVDTSGEKLGVALWALYPVPDGGVSGGGQEQVVVLANSDRVMTTVDSIAPIPLEAWSSWTAVKAICAGVPLGEAVDVYASRWRFALGFPVYGGDRRTPLGAVSLSTMTPFAETALASLGSGPRSALEDLLVRSAEALLTIGKLASG